jgi:photosystem II stability/assembly factor-like uncharacterized protein
MKLSLVKSLLVLSILCTVAAAKAQPQINIADSGRKTSLRGLSVVNDDIIWASGSNGNVARSINGGKSFEWQQVKGYETRDFRDVEAFDANTALVMAIAEPAVILKTSDGGHAWREVFRDTAKGMFLDAMDFSGKYGAVIGDPLTNKPFFAYTSDYGEHWQLPSEKEKESLPVLDSGEAFFASSGTNLVSTKPHTPYVGSALIVSGGMKARLLRLGTAALNLPLVQGKTSTGANSVAVYTAGNGMVEGVIAGGDFAHDQVATDNFVLFSISKQGKITFSAAQTPPHGYRSSVAYLTQKQLIACGTSGVDISNDGGVNWQQVSRQSFHVCQKAKNGKAVFLAGSNGKIAVYK